LNAVRAILILEGVNPRTHEEALTMLSLRLVKPGLLTKEFVKKFELLLSRRTEVDYGDLEIIDSADAEDSYNNCKQDGLRIRRIKKKMIKSLTSE